VPPKKTKRRSPPATASTAKSNPPTPWIEIPVFIHGVTPDRDPEKDLRDPITHQLDPRRGVHDAEYASLFQLIQRALDDLPEHLRVDKPNWKEPLEPASQPIKIEWGWGLESPGGNSGALQSEQMDRYLAEVERKVADRVIAIEKSIQDRTINPLRSVYQYVRRDVFPYAVPDLFYYVSRDGELTLRKRIFTYLCDEIERRAKAPARVSLTLIGHSAGSVIAHDLLFHLFRQEKDKEVPAVNRLRARVEAKELRVRRFYTFGSPITALMFRSNSLVEKVMTGSQLNPENLGLRSSDKLKLSVPRWVNFWDIDDILSFPVEPFYRKNASDEVVVEDHYIDDDFDFARDWFPKVHNSYWRSPKVAQYIAETL